VIAYFILKQTRLASQKLFSLQRLPQLVLFSRKKYIWSYAVNFLKLVQYTFLEAPFNDVSTIFLFTLSIMRLGHFHILVLICASLRERYQVFFFGEGFNASISVNEIAIDNILHPCQYCLIWHLMTIYRVRVWECTHSTPLTTWISSS